MTEASSRKIAIVGAGPVGLEAALYARALGHQPVVYERATVADNVAAWGFVRLFSPWSMNSSPLGRRLLGDAGAWTRPSPGACPTGAELRQQYLCPLAKLLGAAVREHTAVITIGRDDFGKADAIGSVQRAGSPFRMLVRDTTSGHERIEHADIVFDCSGTYRRHRWAGRGGVPAPGERGLEARIWYLIPDVLGQHRDRFADRHTLLLGAGFSAATVLAWLDTLARDHPRTRVTWAIRRPGQALEAIINDPLINRRELVARSLELAEHPPPWLQFLGTCALENVRRSDRFEVTLKYLQTNLALAVDEIVAMVGYQPDPSIYEHLQVHQCYATGGPMKLSAALLGESAVDCLGAGASLGPDVLRNPEPNFYILGAKSYGTNSNFLMRTGRRQVRDVFRLIQSDPTLDLYGDDPVEPLPA